MAQAEVTLPVARRSLLRRATDEFVRRREASILVVALALGAYFWIAKPVFLSRGNLVTISQYVAPWALIATGEVLLLVSGEIDLSVGNVYALAPFLMHFAVDYYHVPVIPAIILVLLIGAFIGLINGLITVVLHVPSFITTLGTLFALNGITLIVSHAFPALIPTNAVGIGRWLGGASWSEIIWALLVMLAFQTVLTNTRWGLHTVAVGGNLLGASEAGVNVGRVKIGNFMITSTLGAFTGMLEAFRVGSIDPLAGGTEVMFFAVAACVIGGTALAGGSGTILGAFVGALVLGILHDGFNLIGINAFAFSLILGVAILAVMTLNVYLARLRRAGRV
jgi:simple sugar transport system permease protein